MSKSYMKKPKVILTNGPELAGKVRVYCKQQDISYSSLSTQCFNSESYIRVNLINKGYRNHTNCKIINEKTGLDLTPIFEIG